MPSLPSGVLLVNKPRGITSHDVVDRVRNIAGTRKVGHAGTLDPLADGLLIILIGDATKRQAEFMAGEKAYVAAIRFGATSTTDDAEGEITEVGPPSGGPTSKHHIEKELKKFLGEIEQVPPAYSAVKVGGKKAYEAARRGKPLTLKPRRVTIAAIETVAYSWPLLTIRVVCSPGTYIRALARDIGEALDCAPAPEQSTVRGSTEPNVVPCGAYLEALTRTRSGKHLLKDAIALNDLTPENWRQHLAKIEDVG